ncbi:hypothetical protein AB0C68_14800 [Streptomyces tendae]|uniref:hypothetical protein n=1 Tax=Streptomyces tendae TaxID=1932 RepID=UPI0033D3FC37
MTWVTAGNRASTENTGRTTPTTGTARATGTANAAGTATVPRADVPRDGVPHRRARPSVRAVALGLSLAGALVLTACTDDGGSDGGSGEGSAGGDTSSAAPSASASTEPGDGGGGSPSAGAAGELEGSWLATTDGQAVALMVTGDKAALFATGGTVCSGTTQETSGTRTIHLKCTDGNDDRTTGKVGAVDATSLTVAWEGELGEETYTRSEGGSLPPGLPTAGLGS